MTVTDGPVKDRFDLTDSGGQFRLPNLPAGAYTLTVTADGFLAATQQGVTVTAGQQATQDFTLTADANGGGGAISGKVRDPEGGELADVRVTVIEGPSVGQVATTDAEGDYTLSRLPVGTYTVRFTRSGFQDLTISGQAVVQGETTALDTILQSTEGLGVITGTVTTGTGTAVDGARVEVFSGDQLLLSDVTDALGQYRLEGLRTGTYTVRVLKSLFVPAIFRNVAVETGEETPLNVQLTFAGDAGTLEGVVRDTGGRAVQGTLVEITGPLGIESRLTDAEGRFSVDVPAGDYTVRVSMRGMVFQQRLGITVRSGDTTSLVFTLRLESGFGAVVGTVRDPSGLPVVGATVTLLEGPEVNVVRNTSSSGVYGFFGLQPGVYLLQVSANGFQSEQLRLQVRQGVTIPGNFFLQRAQ